MIVHSCAGSLGAKQLVWRWIVQWCENKTAFLANWVATGAGDCQWYATSPVHDKDPIEIVMYL